MGSWGVKATQSDTGLDYFTDIQKEILSRENYEYFHLKAVKGFLAYRVYKSLETGSYGYDIESAQDTFEYRYSQGIILIAECFEEYYKTGKLEITLYNEKILSCKYISQFIFSENEISELIKDLRNILNPEHPLYEDWKESEHFNEWLTHIESLITTLVKNNPSANQI